MQGPVPPVDFAGIFAAQPTAYLVMSPELVILEANPAYLQLLGRTREELVGVYVFDAFPPSPDALDAEGRNPLQLSFERARDTGRPDQMPLFRYDVLDQDTGETAQRAWSLISVPVLDEAGVAQLILQRVEDVTEYLAQRQRLAASGEGADWQHMDELEADLFAPTRELREAVTAQEVATRRLAGLAAVTLQLATAGSVADVVEIVTGAGLAALGADGGAVGIADAHLDVVHLTRSSSLTVPAEGSVTQVPLSSRRPEAWVIRHDEALTLSTRAAALEWSGEMVGVGGATGQQAWLAVPLRSGGQVLGSLLATWTTEQQFTDADLELVQAFAAQCAGTLERLQALVVERRTATENQVLAETLQRSMLTAPPAPDHTQIVVRYLPATETAHVGGDWYDAFLQPDGATALVVGDVVGHDTAAAAAMGQLRSMLRGIATIGNAGPATLLTQLDTAMAQLQLETYATVAVARFEQTPDEAGRGVTRMRWSNAGHPAPLVIHPDGTLAELAGRRAELMLGVAHDTPRTDQVITLDRQDTVLLYTDGLVERRDRDLDEGLAALRSAATALAHLPLDELCDGIIDRLVGAAHDDDVALVAIRLHRQDRPRPAEAGPVDIPPTVPADTV